MALAKLAVDFVLKDFPAGTQQINSYTVSCEALGLSQPLVPGVDVEINVPVAGSYEFVVMSIGVDGNSIADATLVQTVDIAVPSLVTLSVPVAITLKEVV